MLIKERRQHRRKACLIPVDCTVRDHSYKEFFLDISSGGVFIETRRSVYRDQEIKMTFPHPVSHEEVTVIGRVVWTSEKGFGVRFKRLAHKDEPEIRETLKKDQTRQEIREEKKMGKIRQKKIRWEASPTPGIATYKLYWSTDTTIDYSSPSIQVGKVNEIVLPEGVPSFPLIKGPIALGVSAVNEGGNESDITKMTADFNFVVPDAPKNFKIEDI